MKKMCIVFTGLLFALFLGTNMAQEIEKDSAFLPESTRKSLIAEFSNHPDLKNYPNFVNHLIRMINHERHRLNVDERVAKLLGGNGRWAIRANVEDLKNYFQACSDDGLTMLRTMGAAACLWRKSNTLNYMDGRDVNRAMKELKLSSGLALPIENLRLFAYIPNPDRAQRDEAYQCDPKS